MRFINKKHFILQGGNPGGGGGRIPTLKGQGCLSYLLGIKKEVLLSLRVFRLKKVNAVSFEVSFRVSAKKNMTEVKAGVHMKAVFWLVIMVLTQMSRSRFKQSRISMLIQRIYVLVRFVNFWVIFRYIWR